MDAVKAIYLIAMDTGTPTTAIGVRLGHAKTYLSSMALRGSVPSAHNLADMLGVCGYSLVAVPSDKLPPDGIVIGAAHDQRDTQTSTTNTDATNTSTQTSTTNTDATNTSTQTSTDNTDATNTSTQTSTDNASTDNTSTQTSTTNTDATNTSTQAQA